MSTHTAPCIVVTPLPRPGPRPVFTPPLSPVEEKEEEVQAQEPETEAPREGSEEESNGTPQESGGEAMMEGDTDEVASEHVERSEERAGEEEAAPEQVEQGEEEVQEKVQDEVQDEVQEEAAPVGEGYSHGTQLPVPYNILPPRDQWINFQQTHGVGARLFIGNLPTGLSYSAFHNLIRQFARFGPVAGRLRYDHHRNLHTAFVQYTNPADAASAFAAHQANPVFIVDGRILRVEWACGGRYRQLASFPQQQQQPVRRPSPQVQYGYYPPYPAWDINGQPMYPQPVMPMHAHYQVHPAYMAPPPPHYGMDHYGNYMPPPNPHPNPNYGDGGFYYGHHNNAAASY